MFCQAEMLNTVQMTLLESINSHLDSHCRTLEDKKCNILYGISCKKEKKKKLLFNSYF